MPDWEAVHVILPESSGINNTPIGEGGGGPRDIGSFFLPSIDSLDDFFQRQQEGVKQVTMVESASLQERLERWAQRLQNLTVSPLTRDYPDNQKPEQVKRVIEAFESYQLPNEAQLALKKVSGASSSGFTAFLAAFVVLVARLTGDEDIAIGTNSSDDGRPFVLRVSIDPSDTFVQLYGKVEKVWM